MTPTCPFCGAAEDPKFLPKRHADDAIAYACGAVSDGGRALWRSDECHAAEVARLTKERDEAINARNVIAKNIRGEMILKMQEVATERDDALAEVARLKAGGCARDQRTTQWCAEAVALQERVKRLEEAGDEIIWAFCPASVSMMTERESDALKCWNNAKEAKP